MNNEASKLFAELLKIMHRLRQECPWDQEQDLSSLRPYVIEEAYEVLDAMEQAMDGQPQALLEELGDLQLQILFQAELLSEKTKNPEILNILEGLRDKLIRRHPHVFDNKKNISKDQVVTNWDQIKAEEKGEHKQTSLMKDVPLTFPSLLSAQKIGQRSNKVGFDWNTADEVWTQFKSELQELEEAKSTKELEHELGDVFFSLVQWARHRGLDAEVSLAQANQRFLSRFRAMEAFCRQQHREFMDLSREEKERLWKRAKEEE